MCIHITYHLTHWGRVTHICVGKLTIIGSDNGLSPGQRQAIIWTNDGILLIRTLGTNFSEILNEIHSFSFKETHLKMSSAKWRLSRIGLNELNHAQCAVLRCVFVAVSSILSRLMFSLYTYSPKVVHQGKTSHINKMEQNQVTTISKGTQRCSVCKTKVPDFVNYDT